MEQEVAKKFDELNDKIDGLIEAVHGFATNIETRLTRVEESMATKEDLRLEISKSEHKILDRMDNVSMKLEHELHEYVDVKVEAIRR